MLPPGPCIARITLFPNLVVGRLAEVNASSVRISCARLAVVSKPMQTTTALITEQRERLRTHTKFTQLSMGKQSNSE
jgi:phospholipid N-methyltransferase